MANLHVSNPVITPSGEWLWCPWFRESGFVPIAGITVDDLSGASITIDGVTSPLTNYAFNGKLGGILFPLGKPRTLWGEDEDDIGSSSTGTWATKTPTGSAGGAFGATDACNSRYHESSDPAATWTWPTISGLSPGKHRVYGHIWGLVGPDRTTDAHYVVKDGSGTTLATLHRDLTTPLYPQFDKCISGFVLHLLGEFTIGAGQTSATITLSNGSGSGALFADAMFVESHFDPPVHPGQTITVSIPAGAVHDAFDGPLVAVDNMPVAFTTDEDFFHPIQPPDQRTLKVGYNTQGNYENWPNDYLADRSMACDMWKGQVTLDDHFVMTANSGTASRELLTTSDLNGDQGLSSWGMRLLPDGVQRFEFTVSGANFDDAARLNVNIVNRDGGQHWVIGGKTWTDLGGNRWRLEVPIAHPTWQPISTRSANFNPAWSQGLRFEAATPGVIYTDWRWYDSGVPIGYNGVAHPHLVNTYKDKVKVLRGMDSFGTNASPVFEIDHYSGPADDATPLTPGTGPGFKFANANVLAIHPVDFDATTDPDHFNRYFDLNAYYCWMVVDLDVDPVAAGFGYGPQIQWQTGSNLTTTVSGFVSNFAATMLAFPIPGNRLLLANLVDNPGVIDHYDTTGNVRATIATTYTPGAPIPIWIRKNHSLSPETFFDVCREINAEPWINFAHAGSDNYVRAMMQKAIARTPDGRIINGEYSNETWSGSFSQSHYFPAMAHYTNWLNAQDPVANPATVANHKRWIVHRALQIRALCRDELTLAGRDPDLFHMNFDSIAQAPGETDEVIAQMQAEGQILDQRDCVAIEGYQDSSPPNGSWEGPNLDATWSRCSVDGFVDLLATGTCYGSRPLFAGQHRSKLDAAGFTGCGLSGYETGWAYIVPTGDPRNVADVAASPRMFRLTAAEQAGLQDCGYTISNKYADIYYANIGNNVYWTDFTAVNQGLGTGSPSENPNAVDYPNVVSQTAGGRLAFASGFDFGAATGSGPTQLAVTGPGTITTGVAATYTATLDHAAGAGGASFVPAASGFTATFSPNPVAFAQGDISKTFSATSSTAGTGSIGGAASGLTTTAQSVVSSTITNSTTTMPNWYRANEDARSVLASPRPVGGNPVLASAAEFVNFPTIVTAFREATDSQGNITETILTRFTVTGKNVNTLTFGAVVEGATDAALLGTDIIECRVDEIYAKQIQDACDTLAVAITSGLTGPQGPAGPAGPGVPVGGATGQVLAKASITDRDTHWVDQAGGGSPGGSEGDLQIKDGSSFVGGGPSWDGSTLASPGGTFAGGTHYSDPTLRVEIDLAAATVTPACSFVFPGGQLFSAVVASVFGAADIFFQVTPTSLSSFGCVEAFNSGGLTVGTGTNQGWPAGPISFRPGRVEKMRLDEDGKLTIGGGTYAFPASDGAGVLTSNGSGTLSWGAGAANGVVTTTSYVNPTWISSLAGSKINTASFPFPYNFGGTGTPTIANDVTPWLRVGFDSTVARLTLTCKSAPTGNFQITIKRSLDSGSTFPDTIGTVTVASGAKLATSTTFTNAALTAGDVLRCDVNSVNAAADWSARLVVLSKNQ